MLRSYIAILAIGALVLYTMSSIIGCCCKGNKYKTHKLKYYNVKGSNICYITLLNGYSNMPNIIPCSDIPATAKVDTVLDQE